MGREAVTPRDFLMSLSSFRWSTLTAAGQAAAAAAAAAAVWEERVRCLQLLSCFPAAHLLLVNQLNMLSCTVAGFGNKYLVLMLRKGDQCWWGWGGVEHWH